MNPLRFHLFKTESFKVSTFERFIFLYIYAFVFLHVYISTHLYLQIYRNSFSIQQGKKHQNVAGQGEKYYICRYEERIGKMADGYSQIYGHGTFVIFDFWRYDKSIDCSLRCCCFCSYFRSRTLVGQKHKQKGGLVWAQSQFQLLLQSQQLWV